MVNVPQIELANLGMADSLILMVLALVVFGPRRLPQIGRQIGKLMYEFRKASNDFKFQMEEELRLAEDADRRKKLEEERQNAALSAPPTVEAQADIGAAEPATAESATGEPSPYPGEETYPPQTNQTAEAEPEQVVIPRVGPVIKPPSTGDPIPAARYGAIRETEPAVAAPDADAEAASSGAVKANPTGTESASQND